MAQNERILDYLTKNGSITQAEAMEKLGCSRLASRINELKDRGVDIRRTMEEGTNRFGEPVRYARYFMGVLDGRSELNSL